jgi:hypothetical protein
VPHLVDAKLSRRLKLRFRNEAAGYVKNVSRPNAGCDHSFFDPRCRNDENVSADVAGDEPSKCLAFPKSAAANPAMKGREHKWAFSAEGLSRLVRGLQLSFVES